PVIRPLYNTAQALESFLVWAGKAKRAGKESIVAYQYIKANFAGDWNMLVHNGSVETKSQMKLMEVEQASLFQFDSQKAAKLVNALTQNTGKYEVVFYQKNGIGDGQQAANPWL